MISAMLEATDPRWQVRESPTKTGMVGRMGPMPPASNMIVSFSAEVRWASMAAAQGAPVPTTTVAPSSR